MKAKKSNKAYSIEEREVKHFQSQGYDIYDDFGKLVAFGAGKMVSAEKYFTLLQEKEKLEQEIDKLVEKLEKKQKKEKKEDE